MRALTTFDARLGEIDGHTFYTPPLGPNSIVLDLGAAGATFSTSLADTYGCRCFAAEALPANFRLIPPHPKVRAFPVAISGVNGPISLIDRATHHTSASYRSYDGLAEKGAVTVDSVTIERFLDMAGVDRVDLLKLDIEGAEFEAIQATSDDTLRRIAQLTVEFHDFLDPQLTPACQTVIDRLAGLGFHVLRFTRQYHGDVLFLNRCLLDISPAQVLWFRQAVRPIRGIGRLVARHLTAL